MRRFAPGEDVIDLTTIPPERGFETIAAALSGFGTDRAVLTFGGEGTGGAETVIVLRGVDPVALRPDDFLFL